MENFLKLLKLIEFDCLACGCKVVPQYGIVKNFFSWNLWDVEKFRADFEIFSNEMKKSPIDLNGVKGYFKTSQ